MICLLSTSAFFLELKTGRVDPRSVGPRLYKLRKSNRAKNYDSRAYCVTCNKVNDRKTLMCSENNIILSIAYIWEASSKNN